MPDFVIENQYQNIVAGVDEAGRGSWAGPVVSAAVILPPNLDCQLIHKIDDSKKLKKNVRIELFAKLTSIATIGIGTAKPSEIDNLNILQATMQAMRRAVCALPVSPTIALVDGNRSPPLDCKVRTIVKGDSISLSIAAASIIAKVTRDRIMEKLAKTFPGYQFERNAGYGTKAHREAIQQIGISSAHRRSFAPIRAVLARYSE